MRFRLVIGATGDVSEQALNPAAAPSASAAPACVRPDDRRAARR